MCSAPHCCAQTQGVPSRSFRRPAPRKLKAAMWLLSLISGAHRFAVKVLWIGLGAPPLAPPTATTRPERTGLGESPRGKLDLTGLSRTWNPFSAPPPIFSAKRFSTPDKGQWPHCGLELPRGRSPETARGSTPWVWAQFIASATSPRMSKLRDLATVNIFGVLGALELEPGPGWHRSGRSGAWKSRSASRSGRSKDSTSGGAESTVVEPRHSRIRKGGSGQPHGGHPGAGRALPLAGGRTSRARQEEHRSGCARRPGPPPPGRPGAASFIRAAWRDQLLTQLGTSRTSSEQWLDQGVTTRSQPSAARLSAMSEDRLRWV